MSAPTKKKKLAVVLGGLGGAQGNGARLLEHAEECLTAIFNTQVVVLASAGGFPKHQNLLGDSDAFVFVTGTYWDSWSSHLQLFLEEATPSEMSDMWLGKPAAVWVTAHSVGGKGVCSRLQGVLSTFGLLIPPATGVVITKATELACKHAPNLSQDFWSMGCLNVSARNLRAALDPNPCYVAWQLGDEDPGECWIPEKKLSYRAPP